MSTATPDVISDELTEEELLWNGGDWGKDLAHYASKHGMVEAMIEGKPVVALCGWMFVPRRDPKKFPVCPRCAEIHATLPPGGDD